MSVFIRIGFFLLKHIVAFASTSVHLSQLPILDSDFSHKSFTERLRCKCITTYGLAYVISCQLCVHVYEGNTKPTKQLVCNVFFHQHAST